MKAAFYLDQRADQEQVDALSKIFSGQSGGFFAAAANFIGENIGIKSSQIEFGIQGKRRWLTIPEYLELEIEGIKGSDTSQDSLVTNPAFTVAPSFDPVIARSMKHHYRDQFWQKWLLFKIQVRANIIPDLIFHLHIYLCRSLYSKCGLIER